MRYTQKKNVKSEMKILREENLEPEEIFLLSYLRNYNRTASRNLQRISTNEFAQ